MTIALDVHISALSPLTRVTAAIQWDCLIKVNDRASTRPAIKSLSS
jgi:hypothetical protein